MNSSKVLILFHLWNKCGGKVERQAGNKRSNKCNPVDPIGSVRAASVGFAGVVLWRVVDMGLLRNGRLVEVLALGVLSVVMGASVVAIASAVVVNAAAAVVAAGVSSGVLSRAHVLLLELWLLSVEVGRVRWSRWSRVVQEFLQTVGSQDVVQFLTLRAGVLVIIIRTGLMLLAVMVEVVVAVVVDDVHGGLWLVWIVWGWSIGNWGSIMISWSWSWSWGWG